MVNERRGNGDVQALRLCPICEGSMRHEVRGQDGLVTIKVCTACKPGIVAGGDLLPAKPLECPTCGGSGECSEDASDTARSITCPTCRGSGEAPCHNRCGRSAVMMEPEGDGVEYPSCGECHRELMAYVVSSNTLDAAESDLAKAVYSPPDLDRAFGDHERDVRRESEVA